MSLSLSISRSHEPAFVRSLGSAFLPYVSMRRAGVPFRGVQDLRFVRSLRISDQILLLEGKNTLAAADAIAVLERLIGSMPLHSPMGRELIHFKRDIFNDRVPRTPLTEGTLEQVALLASPESSLLMDWIGNREKREELLAEGEDVMADEMAAQSIRLRKLTRRSGFRAALDLASPALCDDLTQYWERPSRFSAGQKSRIERSLIRYYTRSAVKLSPFSSFMSSRILRITSVEDASHARKAAALRRSVKTNRSIPAQLAQRLSEHPELRQFVPVSASGSVVRTGDKILVLRQKYDASKASRLRIPAESLVEFEFTAAIGAVMEELSSGQWVPFASLVSTLAPLLGGTAATSDFIVKLTEIGLLLHKVPLPQDDSCCVGALRQFLTELPAPDPRLAELAQELKRVEVLQAKFSSTVPGLRLAAVKAIDTAVQRAHHLIDDMPPPRWTGRLISEEMIEEPAGALSPPPSWLPAIQDLTTFLKIYVPLLDLFASVRASMRELLVKEFDGGPVPFLVFAAQYRRAMPIVRDPKISVGSLRNPFKLEILMELEKIRNEIGSVVMLCSNSLEVDLRAAAQQNRWSQRLQDLGIPAPIGGKSAVTCFIQPFTASNGDQSVVVNQIDAGPGRTLSRALAGFEDRQHKSHIAAEVSRSLNDLWEGTEPCTISAAFDYNLNACPAFTERTIDYGGNAARGDRSISLGSLFVSVTASGGLRLSAEGQEVIPVHFGAMNSAYQPLIPALLLAMGRSEPILVRPFDPRNWGPIPATMPDVMHFPRLVFGRCLARRQAWLIRKAILPRRKAGESPFVYFVRMRKWQQELELPDEMFVRVRGLGERRNEDNGDARSSGLPQKPQYVDFRNYLLLESLDDLFKDVLTAAYFEEALPSVEDWTSLGLGRAVELALDAFLTNEPESGPVSTSSNLQ
jgi:hypothetical protein